MFEQNLLNDSNLHKSVLRFQEQKLVVNLEMREVGGSFGFAIVSFQRLTVSNYHVYLRSIGYETLFEVTESFWRLSRTDKRFEILSEFRREFYRVT